MRTPVEVSSRSNNVSLHTRIKMTASTARHRLLYDALRSCHHAIVGERTATAFALLTLALISPSAALAEERIDFTKDIRPILSENCSFCHGPDEQHREADLRLDTSEGAWSVIKKGSSKESELYRRILTDDPDLQMPPAESNRRLTTKQRETIRQWIDQGAEWEQLWSLQPLRKPPIPETPPRTTTPRHNPIDAFVQERLRRSSLQASSEASRETLIRRLSLDLTGLPPTPEQTRRFLEDDSDDAYEQLVNRVLKSRHYGQRMAWAWLDAARYADTNGYQGDSERTMWPWRDWVVQAFNENLPYDQFTLWQLAGDLLPESSHQQKLATAFNRNHMINGEGGRIAEENRVEYVMDMTETMGTVWLGMTLNCCRCHDHKYDPILNREYYQLFAFFNQTSVNGAGGNAQTPPVLQSPSPQQRQAVEELIKRQQKKVTEQRTRSKELHEEQQEWEQSRIHEIQSAATWTTLKTLNATSVNSSLLVQEDGSILAKVAAESQEPPPNDTYTILVDLPKQDLAARKITSLRLDTLRHADFQNSLSHSDSGNFVLTEISLRILDETGSPVAKPVQIKSAEATFEQGSHLITNAFDGSKSTGWAVYEGGRVSKDHAAIFRFNPAIDLATNERLEITLAHDSVHEKHNIGRFLLSSTDNADLNLSDKSQSLLAALVADPEKRNQQQKELITNSQQNEDKRYREISESLKEIEQEIQRLRNAWPKVMVMADQPQPRKTYLLERGLYNQPKEEVTAGLPSSVLLAAPSTAPQKPEDQILNRLDLAKWLIHPDHPLTARVTVNRFWQQFFGTGLVETTEDFGTQGETPEHLDLLNWLAKDFLENNWDVKDLVRKIVTSHTYRQSSVIPSKEAYDVDPSNRLLSRAPRYRLPAWMIRDQALAVSGLLSPVSEGPSVNTYQPAGVWEEASFGKKKYRQDTGEKLYRRSLYVFWRRIIAPTMFFDNASRQTCTVRTGRTNTPLHALQTLNGTTYVESARELAKWSLHQKIADLEQVKENDLDQKRIDLIMNRVLARKASEDEKKILVKGLERARGRFAKDQDASVAFLSVGESPHDESLDAEELAAWSSLCLAVLNFDETLNRE